MIVLRGVRPVALQAAAERDRLRACPHRAQAAVNHARALKAAAAPQAGVAASKKAAAAKEQRNKKRVRQA